MPSLKTLIARIMNERDTVYEVTRKSFLFFSWEHNTVLRCDPTTIKEDLFVDTRGHEIRDVYINGKKYIPSKN